MCVTLPEVLVTVMGIDKLVPRFQDLEVFLQLLPRSSTGERMNSYTSLWSGVTEGDGPDEFHLVLLDGGCTEVLADEAGRRRCPASAAARASTCARSTSAWAGTRTGRCIPGRSERSSPRSSRGSRTPRRCPRPPSLCGACYKVCPVSASSRWARSSPACPRRSLRSRLPRARAPLTLVSGPSDVGHRAERVEGVHGPRVLDVVIVV